MRLFCSDIHAEYDVQPLPPLITNPEVCAQLSTAALKRNLAGHAACNPNIVATGTKTEMVERLERILKMRKMDLLVRDMIWAEGDDDDGV
jgi:hypothetical protein